ncbi:MAG TPA: ATP-binding protein [Terriglobales bacterium]|nr:ATP-binding protein [Terriglobales bacterium]
MATKKKPTLVLVEAALKRHFKATPLQDLVTASRTFPLMARVDVQVAVNTLLGQPGSKLLGVHRQYSHETLTFANLMQNIHDPAVISPLQYEEIDIGDAQPVRCLRQGLWMSSSDRTRFALLLSSGGRYGRDEGTHLEIAVPPGEMGANLSRQIFENLEALIKKTSSYRGKVISLEQSDRYSGHMGTLRVQKLRSVRREDVILPAETIQILDRNVRDFIAQRQELQKLGMPIKKGLLFYGPPGTGKTHTIHYLASQLPDHTTLLVTAEQVALLDHYFQLARFLQPAMIVIEDVDLVARRREEMYVRIVASLFLCVPLIISAWQLSPNKQAF